MRIWLSLVVLTSWLGTACAAPPAEAVERSNWEERLRLLAGHELLAVKCSSLQAISDGDEDRGRDLMQFLAETFGTHRLIWGSGWPVLPDGQPYQQALQFCRACIGDRSELEREAIFGGNARRIYGLA